MSQTSTTRSTPNIGIAPLRPSDVDFMPSLLRSLSTLLRLKGVHVSPQYLLAGLAGADKVSVTSCLRSAERIGLKSRVMYRPKLNDISPLTLPCILILKNDHSCVLTAYNDSEVKVILPETGEDEQVMPREQLERNIPDMPCSRPWKAARTHVQRPYS